MMTQQTTDLKAVSDAKPRCNWNGWDAFFIIAPVICIILFPLWGFLFLCGRFYPSPIAFFILFLLFPATFVFIFCCLLLGIVRLFDGWSKHTQIKRILLIIEISIPIIFTVLFMAIFFEMNLSLWWSGDESFMYGFRERMKNKADIEDIRDWLKTLRKEAYAGDTNYLPYDDLPESLKVFGKVNMSFSADENGNPKIRLTWGGPFGHWGIEIGMEDMKIPPSDFGEFRLAVEPGVYVWHELQ